MKKATIFLAIIFTFSGIVEKSGLAAQNLDSLYHVWQDPAQPDSSRAKAFDDYIWDGFLYSNPDTAAFLADELIAFGEKQAYPSAQASGLKTKGVSFYLKGDYPKALDYYTRSLKSYEQLGDQQGISSLLGNIGTIYERQGDYPKALNYNTRCLKVKEHLGDQEGIANTLQNIGIIYSVRGDYLKALDYYTRSLKIHEQLGDQRGKANSLNSIGIIYFDQGDYPKALDFYTRSLKIREQLVDHQQIATSLNNIGIIYSVQRDYLKALDYYTRSLKIHEQLGDQRGKASSLNNIGNVYLYQSDYPKALDYYTRSLKIHEQLGDQREIAGMPGNIGNIYLKQADYPKALNYCQKSYERALAIGVLPVQKNACQCLYETYKAMGKGNEALVYLEKLQVINDSLKSEETSKILQQIEFTKVMLQDSIAKAEEARLVKEAHRTEVRKKNQARNVFIGSSLLLLLLAGGFFSRWRYIRKSRDIISKEKDRSENLLLNILPAEIAAELKEKGRAEARDFDMVSILFTDFKGFTEASAKLSAQDLVAEINTCFEAFDAIISKYNIEKIKTIGDAYMAAGGLPVPTDNSVKNTVLAALEMQEFIVSRKAAKSAKGESAFEMRVGIHTGPVVAGIVGVKKFQYDIWGDTVNTASRMESSGEVGKVNISAATYELVKDDFNCEFRGEIEAKGKGKLGMLFVKSRK